MRGGGEGRVGGEEGKVRVSTSLLMPNLLSYHDFEFCVCMLFCCPWGIAYLLRVDGQLL